MKLLALDTSGVACSAAVSDGDRVWSRFEIQPRAHNRLLPLMLAELMDESGMQVQALDALVCGIGPGSFTGIRIAVGMAQGLASALKIDVYPVTATISIACEVFDGDPDARFVAVAMDARMGQIYWSVFSRGENGQPLVDQPDSLADPEAVKIPGAGNWLAAGDAWEQYPDSLGDRLGVRRGVQAIYPRASEMLKLVRTGRHPDAVPPAELAPLYLRQKVAEPRPR